MKQPRKMKKRIQRSNAGKRSKFSYVRYLNNVELLYSNLKTRPADNQAQINEYITTILSLNYLDNKHWSFAIGNADGDTDIDVVNYLTGLGSGLFKNELVRLLRKQNHEYRRNLVYKIADYSSRIALQELDIDHLLPVTKYKVEQLKNQVSYCVSGGIKPNWDGNSLPVWPAEERPYWRKELNKMPAFLPPTHYSLLSAGGPATATVSTTDFFTVFKQRATEIFLQNMEIVIRSLKEDVLPGSRIDRRELIRTLTRSRRIHTNDGKEEDSAISFNRTEVKKYYLTQNPSRVWNTYEKNCYYTYAMALAS